MSYQSERETVLSDLTLSEAAELHKENELLHSALTALGIKEMATWQRVKSCERAGRLLREAREDQLAAQALGFKSVRSMLYGLRKSGVLPEDQVPPSWRICPKHHQTGRMSREAAQKRHDKNTLPMMIDLLDDPFCNEADWQNADEWLRTMSYEQLENELYDLKHRENCGEFDEELQEAKVREMREERLLATQERLGLLPAPPMNLLAAGAEKESVEMRFVPTGATTNADEDLAAKQIAALSAEDRELYELMSA